MTRRDAMRAAAAVLDRARAARDALPPEEAARRAWRPGGRPVEDLTALIRSQRAQTRERRAA